MERGVVISSRALLVGLLPTALLLLVPPPPRPALHLAVLLHLAGLVAFGLWLGDRLTGTIDEPAFPELGRTAAFAATGAAIVVLSTGTTALVTLASSAALRYDPSLQFLQLLSAMDIVWAGTALMVGVRWRTGSHVGARAAAAVLGLACIASIAVYLDRVGFTPDGGWVVDGRELWRTVIWADMSAAAVALVAFTAGVRARVASAS